MKTYLMAIFFGSRINLFGVPGTSTPVLKFRTISRRNIPSDTLLKATHEGLMSSLKKAMATGRTNMFTVNKDRIIRSQ